MLDDAIAAFRQILTPPFRAILWRSLALTLGLLILAGIGLQVLLNSALALPYPWLDTAAGILSGIGIVVGLAFMVGPVTSLMAGLFADEIAEKVEETTWPGEPAGVALPLGRSLVVTVRFALIALAGNLLALVLLLVPGVNLVAFFVINGYLLGREYFEAAAMRYRGEAGAREFRRRHGVAVFAAGLVIAALLLVPIVNLLSPLFAVAFMVRFHKRLTRINAQAV
ncbi:sulfate transporter family protein [Pseudoxanthobacter sp.]|uniref:sulfate transporter family protein n=1 Tax=Pseudoxanthobacter sp. TaxID=1925742 RepID=UPI002FE0F9FA